ncbi:MAG TPA: hypothetical protein VGP82_08550 [Ktedonobacterales bacterium]|jgi:hypothetical protein|nr:hypothetical protein [Ktedonobacterales bacterium]
MLQRSSEMDRYLSGRADSRFFPPRDPWGQRVGTKLGISYRNLTKHFMGSSRRQAEAILQSPAKITEAVERAIDAALIPPQPHRYRIGLSLRWGVRRVVKPVAVTLGLIPGVEALVWDVPRAVVKASQGRWREAGMTLSIAALDFAPAVVAIVAGIATVGTGAVPVIIAGAVVGWLTQWRYFHPYIRKHYSDRDEHVMQRMLDALTDETFVQRRAQIPANQWERTFPQQARYALAIARHGDKTNVAGAIKQNILKTTHAKLAGEVPQLQRQYTENRETVDALLAATQGQAPSRWHPVKRRRFYDAYADMLDAHESMQQFWRVNTIHRLLFNAYATRNAVKPTLLKEDTMWLASRKAERQRHKR